VTPDVLRDIQAAKVDFSHVGNLPHKKSVEQMHACHALLVTHNNSQSARSSTPGKVFECLASKRPVLAFGPTGSDLERWCLNEGVSFVGHEDPRGQEKARDWLLARENAEQAPSHKSEQKFERHALTTDLSEVFNTVLRS
jgi:hypothetical protein